MLKAFQGFQPKQSFYIILLGLLSWLPVFLFPHHFVSPVSIYPSPAFPFLHPLTQLPGFSAALLSFLFWFLTGYLLVFMNIRHMFLKTRTLLPLFFILTLSTPLLGFFEINNLTLTFPFLLAALYLIFKTYRNNKVDFTFFSAGLWLGIASLICLKISVSLLVVWIAMVTIRPFYFREWFASLIGFLTPWFFIYSIHFLLYDEFSTLNSHIVQNFLVTFHPNLPGTLQWAFLAYLGLLLLFSLSYLFFSLPGLKIKSRKFYGVLFWNIVAVVALGIFFPTMWFSFLSPALLFLVLIFSFYFQSDKKSLVRRILFDLYVAGLLYIIADQIIKQIA